MAIGYMRHMNKWVNFVFLPPANEVWGKVIFSEMCVKNSVHRGHTCVVAGGHAWLWGACMWLWGGGICGCRGVCVVAGGCVWLQGVCMVTGGCAWLLGACMVVGVCMVAGGHAWLWGACMVVGGVCGCGGCVWLLGGIHGCGVGRGVHGCWGVSMVAEGMHGCWGVCVVVGGGCIGYNEIRSMSGRYASYWNAFLFILFSFLKVCLYAR